MSTDILGFSGQTGCFTKAGLGIGSTPAELKTAAPNGAGTDYAIDGLGYHFADDASVAMTAMANQAASTVCLYLVMLDADGNLSTKKGVEVAVSTASNPSKGVQWPIVDVDKCPIGGFKLTLDSTAGGYTGATTSLAASNVTDVYYDFVGGMPSAVQAS